MGELHDLARELRDDCPAVDVTTVVFSRDFAGVGRCVIPQDKVLAVINALEGYDALVKALEEIAADHKTYKGHGDYDEGPHPADYCQTLAREALAKVSTPEQTK